MFSKHRKTKLKATWQHKKTLDLRISPRLRGECWVWEAVNMSSVRCLIFQILFVGLNLRSNKHELLSLIDFPHVPLVLFEEQYTWVPVVNYLSLHMCRLFGVEEQKHEFRSLIELPNNFLVWVWGAIHEAPCIVWVSKSFLAFRWRSSMSCGRCLSFQTFPWFGFEEQLNISSIRCLRFHMFPGFF